MVMIKNIDARNNDKDDNKSMIISSSPLKQ